MSKQANTPTVHLLTPDITQTLCGAALEHGKSEATSQPAKVNCADCAQLAMQEVLEWRGVGEAAAQIARRVAKWQEQAHWRRAASKGRRK